MQNRNLYYIGILALIVIFSVHLNVDYSKIFYGIPNIRILANDAFPMDNSIFKTALIAVIETLEIAFIGTFLGALFAIPLAVFASRNLFSLKIVMPIRFFLAIIRTLPSLLWAVIFVIITGFGPTSGVFATIAYTIGYLSKTIYEAIEGIGNEQLEAIISTGANKIQIIRFSVLPEAANNILSQILFMLEYNLRASTILGFVGAGGVGFYIQSYLKFLEYDKVLSILVLVLITVLIIDYISMKIRDKYLINSLNRL